MVVDTRGVSFTMLPFRWWGSIEFIDVAYEGEIELEYGCNMLVESLHFSVFTVSNFQKQMSSQVTSDQRIARLI